MKTHITPSVLQRLIVLFNHHPQGTIIPGDCGDLQILRGIGMVHQKDKIDVVRLTDKGEKFCYSVLNQLREQ